MRKEVLSFLNSIYGDKLKFKEHKCSSGETRCYAPLGDLNLKHILANARGAGYGLYVRYTCVRPPEEGEGGEYIEGDFVEVSDKAVRYLDTNQEEVFTPPYDEVDVNATEELVKKIIKDYLEYILVEEMDKNEKDVLAFASKHLKFSWEKNKDYSDGALLFGCVEFSDDYIFPDWFDFDSYFKEISHEKRGDNEVRLYYKNKYCTVSPEILEMILSKDAKVAHDCKRDLLKLLKKGKRIDSVKLALLESGYDSTVIDYSMHEVIEKLSDSRKTETRALLAIKSNNYSELTISEAQAKLMAKGYPEIVVLRTIMAYIGDQYLTL